VQQQAFKTYYSSLTGAELLKIASNRRSYLPVARETMEMELRERNLGMGAAPAAALERSGGERVDWLARMGRKIGGVFSGRR
jgi:hypothetical protein